MATNVERQVDAFSQLMSERLTERDLTIEQCVAAYRAYQAELQRFQSDIAPALAQLDTGRGTPLDIEAIIERGRAILASEGIED